MADIEELAQEMRDWADNMPENQQGGDKHSEIEQAADTLEEQAGNDPVTPETMSFINEVKVTIQDPTPRRRGFSRSQRLSHVQGRLQIIIDALNEEKKVLQWDESKQNVANELTNALEEIESELDGVEFPGMFG
jgi:hypothetical protein